MSAPAPFRIEIPDAVVEGILDRVRRYDWDALPDAGGWTAGAGLTDMRRIAEHWLHQYDWRAAERALNRFPQFTATVDGQRLHFIHEKSANANAPALLLLHGWPGSFFEFMHLVDRFAHPERHGGDRRCGVDVIVPSLPGYGFSGRPAHVVGPRQMANWLHALMTETLGYRRYIAQGGDWGSIIATWMAHDHPQTCAGLHLNMSFFRLRGAGPQTPEEVGYTQEVARRSASETAYQQIQGTRPQTLAYALMDSPVGVAAWIIEKFAAWSDLPRDSAGRPDLAARYTDDQLLTNAMIYLVGKSFATSTWIYKGVGDEARAGASPARRVEIPTAFAAFPDPVFPPPPRSLLEKSFNLIRYTPMPRGGHFAALEEPELFLEDVRALVQALQ